MSIYVRRTGTPEKVPSEIILKDDNGFYHPYGILAENRSIHAYSLYDAYNVNETVVFGITSDTGLELMNSAPWEIQKKEGDAWTTVYTVGSLQAITPVKSGDFKEWAWDQRLNDGSAAEAGEYRVVISSNYRPPFTIMATFNLSDKVPGAYATSASYNYSSVDKMFMDICRGDGPVEYHAFGNPFNYTPGIRDDTISLLQYKAWKKGLDPERLRAAFDATDRYLTTKPGLSMIVRESLRMPSSATHARYEGKPAWIIVYNWEILIDEKNDGNVINISRGKNSRLSLGHDMIFVVDDASGKVAYFNTCS